MSSNQKGVVPPGLGAPPPDRSLSDLVEQHAQGHPAARAVLAPTEDPYRSSALFKGQLALPGTVRFGVVLHAVGHYHWYKVKMSDGGPAVRACALSETGLECSGVRGTGPIPPLSQVLVYTPTGLTHSVILGVVPPLTPPPPPPLSENPSGPLSGWVAQGGGSGRLREGVDRFVTDSLYKSGGVLDFSAGRPLDSTFLEWGRVAETGVGLVVDPFQAYLAAAEACGLFLNLFDLHARLAGRNLLVESAAHCEEFLCDNGEPSVYRGEALSAWEGVGLYAPGGAAAEPSDPADVLYRNHRGALDLPEASPGLEPFHRYREFGGYPGQGRQRYVALPPRPDGARSAGDGDADPGVFHEFTGVDGTFALRSAKGVFIGKRAVLPVPRPTRDPAEPAPADDPDVSGYRYAGEFGDAEEHRVGDVKVDGDAPGLRRAAGVLDLAAHAFNWKAKHPFHYKKGDYALPQESADAFGRADEHLDFGLLADADRMPDPEPVRVRVDDRYGEVNYYRRGCGLSLLEDGQVVAEGGCGERLYFANGNVFIEAPGDIYLTSGKRVVSLSWDHVIRARNSVDVSAAAGEVRVKAERNMQLLAGNGGTGAVLVESKAEGASHAYADRFGEDVASAGVILRAARSEVVALGGDIYLRTGGGDAAGGAITLDADQGRAPVTVNAAAAEVFGPGGLSVYISQGGAGASSVSAAHLLGPAGVVLGADASVAGQLCVGGGQVVDGSVSVTGSVAAGGGMASGPGGPAGQVSANFAGDVRRQAAANSEQASLLSARGKDRLSSALGGRYYAPDDAVGSDRVLSKIGFSYRDPPGDPAQYRTKNLALPEPRWVQMVRLGAASGGVPWEEPPVAYQGQKTYPWPGRAKWAEDKCVRRLASLTMYDAAAGVAADRPGPYEAASLAGEDPATMADAVKTIL